MKIEIRRFEFGGNYTIGKLFIDGKEECYTLEDVVRPTGIKIQNETAIPYGTYKVVIDYSPHFGRDLPHILDVPSFEGIRIHSGNTDKDTEGCILLGKVWVQGDFISKSKDAFGKFYIKLKTALDKKESVIITIGKE